MTCCANWAKPPAAGRASRSRCRWKGRRTLPPDVHIALYRITQEALNNVVKHARAHQVTVRLQLYRLPGSRIEARSAEATGLSVLLSISDDGRGFDPAQVPHNRLGLGNHAGACPGHRRAR